jgi:3-deoxy-7-phosphoheptulonate synthase
VIVTLSSGADAGFVAQALAALGLWVRRSEAPGVVQFEVENPSQPAAAAEVAAIAGVALVTERRSAHPKLDAQPAVVTIAGIAVGAGDPVLMAGPCSVESLSQIDETAAYVRAAGATFLRGGAYKPRTSPYSFQGHGAEALGWMRRAAERHGLRVVTEVTSELEVGAVAEHAHLVQVGSRNMQNFALLRAVAKTGRPVLLKRGMAATIEEWLLAAEHCLVHGAGAVVLCERGVRGFDPSTRRGGATSWGRSRTRRSRSARRGS